MSTKQSPFEDYEELMKRARETTAALGEMVEDANGLGIGPLGLKEARAETLAVGRELASQMGDLMGVTRSWTDGGGALNEEALRRATEVLQELSLRLRRLLAPTNTHHLSNVTLAAIPFVLERLPALLLALSRVSTLDPDLSGRLFMLASEIEFYGVLLSLETEREEEAEGNTDSAAAAIDRVRQELENATTGGGGTDVALLRKRLNEALDEAETEDAALEEILTRVAQTSEQIEVERSNLDHLVAIARERGASWNKIAKAIGISAQSAHKRWDPEARAKARKYMQDYSVRRRDT